MAEATTSEEIDGHMLTVDDEAYAPTYAEAFPPLQASGEGEHLTKGESQKNVWNTNNVKNHVNLSIRSSEVTQVFSVPLEERRFKEMSETQFGEKGNTQAKICNDIMTDTGVAIEMSLAKDKSLTVVVTGKKSSVLKAKKQILQKLQTQVTKEVTIPKEHHRFIIGPKGQTLIELELQTATKIVVPRQDNPSDVITVTGTKQGIETACHEIQLISDEQAKLAFIRLPVAKAFHPFISGPNGQWVKDLAERTGARINIPPPSVMSDDISIAGEKDGVLMARDEIQRIYDEKKRTTTQVSVEVNKSQHKYIIGPKGSALREILETTGVSVEVPPLDSPSQTVTLRGENEKLGIALTLVYAKANSISVKDVQVDGWLHRFIIGPKGASIRAIQEGFPNVHIEFHEEQNKVTLEGPPDEVEQVEKGIIEKTNDLKTHMAFVDLKIDPKYHRHIIGRGGANVMRIKQDTGVSIRIPSDEAYNNIVRIEGSPEGVAKAKFELIEMIEKMENEKTRDILIDQRFHKAIIGQQGNSIREIREQFNQVLISFPDPSKQSDIVVLRGPKEDVDKCYKFLQQKVQDLSASSYKAEVHVFKDFHRKIIGKGGATIKKIREDTDTRIDLPGENSESDVITITGKKENVEKAKNLIESIQKEMANISEISVDIPHKFHTSLIGSKGRLIKSIMEECGGVQIRFPSENSASDRVMIRGPKADVEKAKKQLLDLATEKKEAGYTDELRAKPEFHRFLIGRGGASISKIREQTGVRFVFPGQNDPDQEVIAIIGRKEAVDKAKQELEAKLVELTNLEEVEISVDPKHHRHFTARRGEIVSQITQDFGGVVVSFPRPQSKSSRVVLKGPKECVAAAKTRMEEIVSDLDAQVTIECRISPKYHGSVMGSKGHRIQEITKEHSVQIKFPDRRTEEPVANGKLENGVNSEDDRTPDSETPPPPPGTMNGTAEKSPDVILITGRLENCEAAKQAMLALVPITDELNVPFEFHGQIIGPKGSFIRKVMEDNDVNISIPPQTERKDFIKITGVKEKIEGARRAIEEKVRQIEEEQKLRELKSFRLEVEVDARHHSSLIGRRGADITKLREDHDVIIQLNEKGSENANVIVITGFEENVHKAKEDILKRVKELEQMITHEISIDHRVHPRIIGSKGRAINKIMQDYKVDIRFPRDSDDKDLVIIRGEEENVHDCADHLLNIAEEYIQDIVEYEDVKSHQLPPRQAQEPALFNQPARGFIVRDAPWSQPPTVFTNNAEEFPDLGSAKAPASQVVWGPASRR